MTVLTAASSTSEVRVPLGARAKALSAAAGFAFHMQDSRAKALAEEALTAGRELGDWQLAARSLDRLACIAAEDGDNAQAIALYEMALAVVRAEGAKEYEPTVLYNLGEIACDQGEYSRAIALYQEALAICEEMGDATRIAWMYRGLGRVALGQTDYERATRLFKKSLTLLRDVGEKLGIAEAFELLAEAASETGQNTENVRQGARLLGAATRVREDINEPVQRVARSGYERWVARVRARLGEGEFAAACAEGRAMTLEQAIAYALEGVGPA